MKTSDPAAATRDLAAILSEGLQQLGITLSTKVQTTLLQFVALLGKWNRAYNLTAVREPAAMVTRHLLDSLAVLPYVQGPRVLDVGSGAGLPGIPLALALPEVEFTLLDSNGKKTRFLTQAVAELHLTNVIVVQSRIEDYHPPQAFDSVVTRAFAAVAEVVAVTGQLCAPQGQLLLMKGAYPAQELAQLPATFELAAAVRLHVPGLDAERHVLRIRARG
ncbi:MAG: 16S rRNA (guanine(527)-N(7))-methyltransferase RsmG [Gammaproteobacteria bacterium]